MSAKTPRTRTVYVCQACGGQTPRWLGRCPECDSWNTLVETVDAPTPAVAAATGQRAWGVASPAPTPLARLSVQTGGRLPVAMAEFNRVLGGGVVPGSVVLLG